MQVRELMTRDVLSCLETDTLERAAQLMWDGDVGVLPVVDPQGNVIGMLTDRDALMAAYTQGCALSALSVGGAMTRDVQTCEPTDSIALTEERMRYRQIRRLPVVEGGRLAGIVSLNDLALAAANRKTAKAAAISQQEIATTLARICEHRDRSALATS